MTPIRPTRIVIADDHRVVLAGLVALFSDEDDMEVAGTATSGAQVIRLVEQVLPDVLVLDVDMPGEGVTGILKTLARHAPRTRIVVFSGMPEQQYGESVARFGAHGFVDKSALPQVLVEAVRGAAQGRYFFGGSAATQPPEPSVGTGDVPRFTSREMQVFLRLAHGNRVTDIAGELGVSLVTVSTHRKSVLAKLGVSNNSELTRQAVRNGFIA
ncbi:MAG: response regulator transcription factor [Comamonadaceae bacterium]|nr:MAG: response regulator transcription factor [Comamonadaceae bacterium]